MEIQMYVILVMFSLMFYDYSSMESVTRISFFLIMNSEYVKV